MCKCIYQDIYIYESVSCIFGDKKFLLVLIHFNFTRHLARGVKQKKKKKRES